MAQPHCAYTPRGLRSVHGYSTEPTLCAGSRARIRYGIASDHKPSEPDRLHAWDVALRNDTGSVSTIRDAFIKDTELDVHDAAAALDRITGGFTIILHCHGSSSQATNRPPQPEEMQFLAYATRDEIEQHAPVFDVPISRIAQIFAADIMPQQSKNYEAKCATSYVDVDRAVVVSRASSPKTHLLIPRPLSTSSTYTFQGYRSGCLEAFLLQRIHINVAVPYADTIPSANQVDCRGRFPSPSVVDKGILRISKQHMHKPSNKAASNSAPALLASGLGCRTQSASRRTKNTDGQEGVGEEGAGKGSEALVRMSESTTAQKPDVRLTSDSTSILFGSPMVAKLFPSQSTRGRDSRGSVSSTSTLDDWEGEDRDEFGFQGEADPSMSSSLAVDGLSSVALPPPPPSQLALTPIISIGCKTEAALAIAGLPDTVHTYLRNLVSTRVNTAWISCLQAAPLSLSSATAAAIYTAVVRDIASAP